MSDSFGTVTGTYADTSNSFGIVTSANIGYGICGSNAVIIANTASIYPQVAPPTVPNEPEPATATDPAPIFSRKPDPALVAECHASVAFDADRAWQATMLACKGQ